MTDYEDRPAAPRPRWYRWIAGGVLAAMFFLLTFVPGLLVHSTPFEESYIGWPALSYAYKRSYEFRLEEPRGRQLVREEGGWLAAGLAINLALAVFSSASIVTLFGVLRDQRFTIRTLLWLTLQAAVLLGAWIASGVHNTQQNLQFNLLDTSLIIGVTRGGPPP